MKGSEQPPLRGTIAVPGDKSISHRALILGALARGPSDITGLNSGSDVVATATCLRRLGVALEFAPERHQARVEGLGFAGLSESAEVLDAGNSGTTLRLLTGVVAAVPGSHVLTGDASLRSRPMGRIVEPLRLMGASISGHGETDLAPLEVQGGALEGIDHNSKVASAQVKSALLLAGLRASGTTSVSEPSPSRDHTERMLRASGVAVTTTGTTTSLAGGSELGARDRRVPGDISSAFFLIVAAALVPGSDLTIESVGLNPTRTGGLEVLAAMGADISWTIRGGLDEEPFGTVRIKHSSLKGVAIAGPIVPRLVDEIPALAVAATQAEGTTTISDAAELRVKESDRLDALATDLGTAGATIEQHEDGLTISGPRTLGSVTVDAREDHRLALSFAVAGMVAASDFHINGWNSVDTSFPEFLDLLDTARGVR